MLDSLFRNTLSPAQWALLAAVPPAILALYFLKLRRVPVEVPSTYLWMRAIEDLHVNSLWQRLRKSLLLLLQLLLVALAMLALLRPGWQGTRLEGQQIIFVVDNSASMSATDGGGEGEASGATRLAVTKERVAALIDQMERDMSAMIISFNDSPTVVQALTDNRRLLKERLESIKPTSATTDLAGALRLADGLANPGQVPLGEDGLEAEVSEPTPYSLYLFTDGRFDAVEGFSLGNLDPVFVPVGEPETGNLAITALNTRRNEARPEAKEAFVQVANYTAEPRSIVVDLALDSVYLESKRVDTPAGETASLTFSLADGATGQLEAKIDTDSREAAGDRLPLDDNAFASVDELAPGAVLVVTPGNLVLETALCTGRAAKLSGIEIIRPSELENEDRRKRLRGGEYDLVIYDRCLPESAEQMPRANTLLIGAVPPTRPWIEAIAEDQGVTADGDGDGAIEPETVTGPQVIDWNRSHPVMSYVQLSDVLIGESLVVPTPAGGLSLIDSTAGPLMTIAPRDSYEDLVLGFAILDEVDGQLAANTTWFKTRGFPTFLLNVLDYFVGAAGDATRGNTLPGATVEVRPRGGVRQITVTGPGDVSQTLTRDGEEPFVFQQTQERGVYRVESGDQLLQRFAVNLFDGAESDIALKTTGSEEGVDAASIRIGYTDVTAQARENPARKEAWRTILLLAIGVLVFEWYVYNRRVYF
ncbi:MAG: BatA and WFA domain-containing protein [Planctomycetota bacterium]